MSKYLHFTLGPVQGFVSQARRTRDFWAGSFLLSWLTAHAIKAVEGARGTIEMPFVKDDDLLKAVKGKPVEKFPKIGSLPNNFIAEVPEGFDGNVAVNAVQTAWKALADKVWERDKLEEAGVCPDLWKQQIESFWDMAWIIEPGREENGKWTYNAGVLVQRKNWRTYMPPESLGDKCTMMGEWQELSGEDRPKPGEQKKFWQRIKQTAHISDIELRDNERLCAIAYVKRRFVHVWQELDGHKGWKLPTSVPSTSYMAAVHWLEQAIEHADEDKLKRFHDAAKKATDGYGEWHTEIRCIGDKVSKRSLENRFTSLDGRVFFRSSLENSKEFEKGLAQPVLQALANLKEVKLEKSKLGLPSPFYAVLMMDGDNLGKTKEAMGDATALSAALGEFTHKVPDIVKEHNGFLIYAGGDDVLAILPLEDALPCAAAVRAKYMDIFKAKGLKKDDYSISAAIEYAHMKLPLTMILKDAHQLLDDVAKDATGRDAVACRVWKPGGQQQTWAMLWDKALDEDGNVKLAKLAKKLGEDEQGEPGYANKLLYHIRETLEMLDGAGDIEHEGILKILVADYMGSGLLDRDKDGNKRSREEKKKAAEGLLKPLLNQCRVFEHKKDTKKLSADVALLLRFLAQKGVER